MKDGHVTLYDVAARAGVSASTASRALAGLAVSRKNLAAVQEAASALGYVPNEAARSLRVVRTMTIGMVFDQLTSALGMELLGALTSDLDAMGYSLFISTAQGDAERYEQLVRRFLERRVEALICVHGHGSGQALGAFRANNVPALTVIAARDAYADLPMVTDSIFQAAAECIRDLAALGHKRIAVLAPPTPIHLIGDVMAAAGNRAVLIEPPREGIRLAADALVDQWLGNADRPTAVIAFQGEAALIAEAAERRGLRIADDLSLVGIRDRSNPVLSERRRLSQIHINPAVMGAKVAELLAAWLDGRGAPPPAVRVEAGTWIPRDTVGPAPNTP